MDLGDLPNDSLEAYALAASPEAGEAPGPDPALILTAVFTLCFLLITWVLLVAVTPRFAAFYADFSGGELQLPGLTRGLIALSHWLSGTWWWALPALGVALIGLCNYVRGMWRWMPLLLLTALTVALAVIVWVGLYLPRFGLGNSIQ